MSGYMLDSNVLIDIVREPEGRVALAFENKTRGDVSISPIVSGEIRFGMERRPDARSNPGMAVLLHSLRVDRLESPADTIYAKLRAELMGRGKALSPNDYWVAAQALSRNATLVTADHAFHDAGLEALKLEDWRSAPVIRGQD